MTLLVCVVLAVNSPENIAMWNEIRSHYKRMLNIYAWYHCSVLFICQRLWLY